MTDHTPTWPRSTRVAAVLLIVVGAANAVAGGVALVGAPDELPVAVASGLLAAGAITIALGWLVARRSRAALYVALVVFELLLVARVVTVDDVGGTEVVSVVLLVVLVATLWVAAVAVRRLDRAGRSPGD